MAHGQAGLGGVVMWSGYCQSFVLEPSFKNRANVGIRSALLNTKRRVPRFCHCLYVFFEPTCGENESSLRLAIWKPPEANDHATMPITQKEKIFGENVEGREVGIFE